MFTVSFVDARGEPHIIQIPAGERVPLGIFAAFGCEVGVGDQTTVVRMMINGAEIGHHDLPFRADIGGLDVTNGVIGADLNGQNGAAFDVKEVTVYSLTLTPEDRSRLHEYLLNQKSPEHVQFNGKQWLRVGNASKPGALPSRSTN